MGKIKINEKKSFKNIFLRLIIDNNFIFKKLSKPTKSQLKNLILHLIYERILKIEFRLIRKMTIFE